MIDFYNHVAIEDLKEFETQQVRTLLHNKFKPVNCGITAANGWRYVTAPKFLRACADCRDILEPKARWDLLKKYFVGLFQAR